LCALTKLPRKESSFPSSAREFGFSQQSVLLAAIASPDLALTTLEDVLRKTLVTFLAIMGAADVSPALMDAVVLHPKHFGCCLDALDPVFYTLGLRDTVNDDVCSR
jgi:hypothetical protein